MVCAVEQIEKSTFFFSEGRGENVTKMLQNPILLPSVSTLLSPIVDAMSALENNPKIKAAIINAALKEGAYFC